MNEELAVEEVSRELGSALNFPDFPVFDALRGCFRGRPPKYVPQKAIISGISAESRTVNSCRDNREILTRFQGMHINETGKVSCIPDLPKYMHHFRTSAMAECYAAFVAAASS
jgi:hypothetical protein